MNRFQGEFNLAGARKRVLFTQTTKMKDKKCKVASYPSEYRGMDQGVKGLSGSRTKAGGGGGQF